MIPFLILCADLVLRNGKIVTLDRAKPQVEAIAITGGKIVAVGSNAQMAREIQPSTNVIDLNGRLAIPGFIEGHGHFMGLGESKMMLNLRDAKNWEQIVAMVAAAAKEAKPGEWIVGRGWHQEKWDVRPTPNVNGFPVNTTLNAVSPNNPVFLEHVSGHAAFVNDAALAKAGITRDTPNPPGGDITKDSTGRPIGLLNERAQGLVKVERDGQAEKAIDLAAEECISKGITTFEDAGSPVDVIDRLKKRAGDGTLPLRLWVMLRVPNTVIAEQAAKIRVIGYGDNHFTVRAIKKQIDGALGSRGAWMLAPYSDLPSTSGLATETPEEIERTAKLALANGYQLCVHAIGDRANREVLNVYEKTLAGKTDLRWRIEHAQHIDRADIPRFAKLGVFAMMQGIHCTSDAPMVIPRLGAKRAEEGAYVWQSLMKTGAHVGNGTDAPVEDVSPIASYYASVTRLAKDGKVFYPAQKMSRMEALRSYTVENAYAAFEENLKGALKVGMLGDVTVLSQDILTVPDDRILKTEVEYTIVGGKVVYQKGR
ncbi:MAG TPA: amidohydrolase [Bryobacteraceae bacterium]|jgi:predicted amidohydrolase YtcJ|nr:amidohydrolase [Bryobacteraceae bacterium]